jgi:hypothetical protein
VYLLRVEVTGEFHAMLEERIELPQGTLDLLILKALALESMHGWAISERLQQIPAGRACVSTRWLRCEQSSNRYTPSDEDAIVEYQIIGRDRSIPRVRHHSEILVTIRIANY